MQAAYTKLPRLVDQPGDYYYVFYVQQSLPEASQLSVAVHLRKKEPNQTQPTDLWCGEIVRTDPETGCQQGLGLCSVAELEHFLLHPSTVWCRWLAMATITPSRHIIRAAKSGSHTAAHMCV